ERDLVERQLGGQPAGEEAEDRERRRAITRMVDVPREPGAHQRDEQEEPRRHTEWLSRRPAAVKQWPCASRSDGATAVGRRDADALARRPPPLDRAPCPSRPPRPSSRRV